MRHPMYKTICTVQIHLQLDMQQEQFIWISWPVTLVVVTLAFVPI